MTEYAVYLPMKNNEPWVEGIATTPYEARRNIQLKEGCIKWVYCEDMGWKVVAARLRVI
jgi:hypothetical protein